LEVLGIQYYDYLNYTVNLRPPLDEILKAVRREKRKKIRAGERNGLKLQEAKSIEEVALFYQILKKTYQQKKVPLADSSLFTEKFTAYNAEKVYRILLVEYGGQVIGGQALLFYNGIAYAWYMAVDDAYFHLRVSDWLVWKTIEYVRSSGCSLFDFCGAGRPDEKYGVRDFKKSFGGEEVNYGRFIFTPRPRLYGFMNSLYSLGSKK
jgi:serine/alanine adding enzyme